MLNLIIAGGWLMLPILLASILAFAIVCERLWSLRINNIIPDKLIDNLLNLLATNNFNNDNTRDLLKKSSLGEILYFTTFKTNINKKNLETDLEERGRHVVHAMEKHMPTLGTIAAVTPLLGLLGTVIGMIKVFTAITLHGVGNATALAGGISEALLTTAFGLSVAIPALIAHRLLSRKIAQHAVNLEYAVSDFLRRAETLAERREINKRREANKLSSLEVV